MATQAASALPTAEVAASSASASSAGPVQSTAPPKDQPKGKGKQPADAKPAAGPDGEPKLSGKELKLKKAAEKQARRAQEKQAVNGAPKQGNGNAKPAAGSVAGSAAAQGSAQQRVQAQHRRTGSTSQAQRPLTLRRRGSATAPAPTTAPKKKAGKEVGLFGHLYGQPRRQTIEGVSKETHPAVLALGFQLSNYVITGSSARSVAMLLAFKAAIADYTTPPTTSLARHLTSHYLSPQIEYLKSHRPISVSMGNAIRWLKDYIIHIDPDVPENDAKADILDAIDTFIRERITVADTAIAATASAKIRPGSKVVTFAKSSIVEHTLLAAAKEGIDFIVTVVDSRPLFEGRNLVSALSKAGVKCRYALLPAAAHVLADADLVLLGAHAMMANGRLYSRAGTASVAMMAHAKDVPVIVCCESLKFTDRVALDSVVLNEVAPSEELVIRHEAAVPITIDKPDPKKGAEKSDEKAPTTGLEGWNDVQNLQLLNIMYDVTPAQYIDMVITEYGSLPPSSVPVVHRISTERDVRV
ncbi:IF-2B-domain-containing protein [Myriangium duriaei CBS 260.36]|uniref:Translation initiation factor eIF2B subunit delta n=1 Tax=Myriangium duriaei CBS 260.36 TaxID=1168546 RepID=A0A9P4MP75_9PEZI|nr:IF-2B-domain-containing protein [Myriangium duriaei CBS 260.36]